MIFPPPFGRKAWSRAAFTAVCSPCAGLTVGAQQAPCATSRAPGIGLSQPRGAALGPPGAFFTFRFLLASDWGYTQGKMGVRY